MSQRLFQAGAVPLVPGMCVELHADGNVYPANSTVNPQLPILGVVVSPARVVGDELYISIGGDVITVPNILGLAASLGNLLGDKDGSGNLQKVTSAPCAGTAILVTASQIQMYVSPALSATGGGAGATVLETVTTMSSAQILAGTDVTTVAAPGVGKYISVIDIRYEYIAGNSGYIDTSGNTLVSSAYNGQGGQIIDTIPLLAPFMNGTVNQIALNGMVNAFITAGVFDRSLAENLPLKCTIINGPAANGNGTLKVYVRYTIETL